MVSKKVVKWERFFHEESMWEITRKPGKNLLPHEIEMVEAPLGEGSYLVLTYADGSKQTIGEAGK